jgi:hypothetical protein
MYLILVDSKIRYPPQPNINTLKLDALHDSRSFEEAKGNEQAQVMLPVFQPSLR